MMVSNSLSRGPANGLPLSRRAFQRSAGGLDGFYNSGEPFRNPVTDSPTNVMFFKKDHFTNAAIVAASRCKINDRVLHFGIEPDIGQTDINRTWISSIEPFPAIFTERCFILLVEKYMWQSQAEVPAQLTLSLIHALIVVNC
jgi:hypothetical protein